MFRADKIFKNVKFLGQHKSELIICHGDDQGMVLYRVDALVKLSGISPWAVCSFNDYFLFQEDNGGSLDYIRTDEGQQNSAARIEGTFYLFRNIVDGQNLYIPTYF